MIFDKNTTDLVKALLIARPALRDDDRKLIATVWFQLLKLSGKQDISAVDFFKLYVKSELPSSETIRRTRQKLQEEKKQLRGERYNERQKNLEPEVRKVVKESLSGASKK